MILVSNTRSAALLRPGDWGDYLGEFLWSHAAHLTLEHPGSTPAIIRRFEQGFIRRLARRARHAIPYFFAVEKNVLHFPHIHALIAGAEGLTIAVLEKQWKGGFTRILRYDPSLGVRFYVSKSLLRGSDDYGISRRTPRRLAKPQCSR